MLTAGAAGRRGGVRDLADFAAGPDRPGVDPRLRNDLGVLFLVTLDA